MLAEEPDMELFYLLFVGVEEKSRLGEYFFLKDGGAAGANKGFMEQCSPSDGYASTPAALWRGPSGGCAERPGLQAKGQVCQIELPPSRPTASAPATPGSERPDGLRQQALNPTLHLRPRQKSTPQATLSYPTRLSKVA